MYRGVMGRVVFAALYGEGEIAMLQEAAFLLQEKCSRTLEAPISLIIRKFKKNYVSEERWEAGRRR